MPSNLPIDGHSFRRVEVLTGTPRRRRWSAAEKAAIVAKRADRVKMLVYDGTGLVLIWKRLEGARFKWPAISEGVMRLSGAQLAALFEGLDWRRVHAPRIARPKLAG